MEQLEKVGIIYGDVSTLEFKCSVVSHLELGEYVQMYHPRHGWVLGRVDSIERLTDLSLDKAYNIVEGSKVDIKERVSATISIIGYRDEKGLVQYPKTPLSAGDFVYRATKKLISDVIGLTSSKKNAAYVGKLYGHDLPIHLDINKIVQKHVSVLAKTGSGKSYLTGVLLEELMKNDVTAVVIDPHGEYASMKRPAPKTDLHEEFGVVPKGYDHKIIEFAASSMATRKARPLKFAVRNLSPHELLELTNLPEKKVYLQILSKSIEKLRSSKKIYSLKDIIDKVSEYEDSAQTLLSELRSLHSLGIFESRGTKIGEVVKKGFTTIINLRGVPPIVQEFIVYRISYALFEYRKNGKIPPLLLVIEEAHNFIPQQGTARSSKILRNIASEGRKFGLGLMIVSQRPARVDKNVLSQCNTQIVLRVTNPNDLRAIQSSLEGITKGMIEEIKRLPIGVALISGIVSIPLMVRVRPRESMHGGEDIKILDDSR